MKVFKKIQTTSLIAAAALILFTNTTASKAATIYSFSGLSAGDLDPQDNWTASTNIDVNLVDQPIPVAIAAVGNINDGTRPNNGAFSMGVSASTTAFNLSFTGRYGTFLTEYRRAMFGLSIGAEEFYFGAGGDDTQNNKWLIVDGAGGQHFSSAITTSDISVFGDISLQVDTTANGGDGSGSFFVDGVAILDLQNINLKLTSLTGYSDPSSFNGMFISAGDSGAVGNLTLTVIPEPSTAILTLLGLAGCVGTRRRRRRA